MNQIKSPLNLAVLFLLYSVIVVTHTVFPAEREQSPERSIGEESPPIKDGVKTLEDVWFRTWSKNTETGYLHKEVTAELSGEIEHIITRIEAKIFFNVRGKNMENKSVYQYNETDAGQPLGFRYQASQAMSGETVVEGAIKSGKLSLNISDRSGKRNSTLDWDNSAKFPYAYNKPYPSWFGCLSATNYSRPYSADKSLCSNCRSKEHPSLTWKEFVPEAIKFREVTAELITQEKVKISDKEMLLNKIKLGSPDGDIFEWRNDAGQVFKMENINEDRIYIRVDKARALASCSPDVFLFMTIAQTDIPLPEPFKVSTALFNLKCADAGLLNSIAWENDTRQKVTHGSNNEFLLRISKTAVPETTNRVKIPYSKDDMAEYLAANKYLESDDPAIIKAAKEIVGNEPDAWNAALKLSNWVYRNMQKGGNPGFATAKESLAGLAGDCSEHTVLLAALARAVGIPAKVCFGIVYYKSGYYVHMWTKVYVGEWVTLDAINNEPNVGPSHIQLTESSLKDIKDLSQMMGMANRLMGKLKIEVAEYELNGKTEKKN